MGEIKKLSSGFKAVRYLLIINKALLGLKTQLGRPTAFTVGMLV